MGLRRSALPKQETRNGIDEQVDAELEFHLEMRTRELVSSGWTEVAARGEALRQFGDLAAARTQLARIDARRVRRGRRAEFRRELVQDLRYAWRTSARRPLATLVMLVTLGIGIGATSAILTLADAALVRSLPYPRADRLVHLWQTRHTQLGGPGLSVISWPDLEDWRAQLRSIGGLEGYDATNVTVPVAGTAAMLRGARVTAGFFSLLGVQPALGRTLAGGEDRPGGSAVVVLSHGFWRQHFAQDTAVVGRSIAVDGQAHEVVGVLPRGFHFAPVGETDVWLPVNTSAGTRADRSARWVNVVGRLRDGASIAEASAEVASHARQLAVLHPATNGGRSAVVRSLRDEVTGPVRVTLLALVGAAALVLGIACANVAGLLLAQGAVRRRELSLRAALGAGRARLMRQLLTENLVLALGGGLLGIGTGWWGVRVLSARLPAPMRLSQPYLSDLSLHGGIVVIALLVTLTTGALFGFFPALSATQSSLAGPLGAGMRMTANRGRRLLVGVEIALTVVLLVTAGLVGRSLAGLLQEDTGFRGEGLVTMRVALAGNRYQEADAQRRFFSDLLVRVASQPDVRAAVAATQLPLNGSGGNTFSVAGRPEPHPGRRPDALMRGVAGAYFQTLRIPLVAGRVFDERDAPESELAIVVSETLARSHFGDPRAAVGERLHFYAFPDRPWRIIGVAGDVKALRLDEPPPPTVYYSALQVPDNRMSLAVWASSGGGQVAAAVRREVHAMDPAVPVYAVGTMSEQVARSPAAAARRYPLILMSIFAAVALALAAVGLYGVVAYGVAQRTRELGIRAALGARATDAFLLVLRESGLVAAAGIAAGVAAALVISRSLGSLLYGIRPADPWTYLGVATIVAVVAAAATYAPARRAARAEPIDALRAD